MKIKYIVSVSFLVVIIISLTCKYGMGSILRRRFSRDDASGDVFRTIHGISIEECGKECHRRGKCTQAVYNRRVAVCKLMSTHPNYNETSVNKGLVLLSKSITHPKTSIECGKRKCTRKETCTDTNTCEVTECGRPPNSTIKGNMYAVNNIVEVNGDARVKLKCDENGTWVTEHVYHCPFGWLPVYTSCFRVTDDALSWHNAKDECHRLHSRSNLAAIQTQAEKESLVYIGTMWRRWQHKWLWLGAINDRRGDWTWNDGTPVESWVLDPLMQGQAGTDYCMVVDLNSFMLMKFKCDGTIFEYNGICEIEIQMVDSDSNMSNE